MNNPFSGLAAKLTHKDDKAKENAQQEPAGIQHATVSAKSPLSGFAAAFANQSNKPISNAQQKAEEIKQAAEKAQGKAEEVKPEPAPAQTPAQVAPQEDLIVLYADVKLFQKSRDIPIDGVLPGIAFNKVVEVFGEPIDRGENTFSFGNGMTVETDDAKSVVKKISVISGEIITPEGVAVNMEETILNTTYETADEVDVKSNGADYKYFNKAKTRKFTFVSRDGYITKIVSELI